MSRPLGLCIVQGSGSWSLSCCVPQTKDAMNLHCGQGYAIVVVVGGFWFLPFLTREDTHRTFASLTCTTTRGATVWPSGHHVLVREKHGSMELSLPRHVTATPRASLKPLRVHPRLQATPPSYLSWSPCFLGDGILGRNCTARAHSTAR